MKTLTIEEVAQHSTVEDCWIIIRENVYNITKFLKFHPGGQKVILDYGGKDTTKIFESLHDDNVLRKYSKKFLIGKIQSDTPPLPKPKNFTFGVPVPFAEPYWYQGYKSPYYNESHLEFRKTVRDFVDNKLMPFCDDWDEKGSFPRELHEESYKAGIYGAIWPEEFGGTPPRGFDIFHEFIMIDELARCATGGVLWSCFWSFGIALPPILTVGSEFLKKKIARAVITGKKIMSLAVTEPYGGSDIARLKTSAVKMGDYYLVNGEKKFITAGGSADYFTTAVRTGGKGMKGVSLLLIEKNFPGVVVKRYKTQGWLSSSTCLVIFENVKVPLTYLIGKENNGFKPIMYNFNHERFTLGLSSNRFARICIEDAIKYARKRRTFGRRLIDHAVIRHKIAEMVRKVESTHAAFEQYAFQLKKNVDEKTLSAKIALLKVQATKTFEFCAREASQILGGASYQRTGQGRRIERLYREVRVNAIGGGSEEILMNLSMKMSKL